MIYLGRVMFVHIDQRLTPQAFERYLSELGRSIDLRQRGRLVGVVYDIPEMAPMDAIRRRRVADVLSARQSLVSSTTVALALASPSKAARGVLEAIHWMAPPAYAHMAVDTVGEALEFLARFMAEIDPEVYAHEYRRRLVRHGVLSTSVRPPPPSGAAAPSTRRTAAPPSGARPDSAPSSARLGR